MSQPAFIVRPATGSDVSAIYTLIRHLAEFEKAPGEVVNTEQELFEHGFVQQPPLYHAWVAETNGGDIAGMALCYVRYSTWKGPVLYLEDIVVEDKYRGQGMGLALFEACLTFCREKGYRRMTWQVLDWNESAISFYKKWGAKFDAEWLNVSIDLHAQQES